jgi:hypothetical protein
MLAVIMVAMQHAPGSQQRFVHADSSVSIADGCRYVYLDVGANLGVHNRFLFEPASYEKKDMTAALFDDYFPSDRKRPDVCAFAFEPNRRHQQRLYKLQEAYERQGWRLTVLPVAAGISNTQLTFYSNAKHPKPWDAGLDLGFGIAGFVNSSSFADSIPVIVDAIDFASWVNIQIHQRRVPPALMPNDPPDAVLMKMDIEGSEYEVLGKMLTSGALCNITAGSIEWHDKALPAWCDRPQTHCELKPSLLSMIGAMHRYGCAFRTSDDILRGKMVDDEVYNRDGVPLP